MKNFIFIIVSSIGIIGFVVLFLLAGEKKNDQVTITFDRLLDPNRKIRVKEAYEVIQKRKTIVASLLKLAQLKEKETIHSGTKELAIDLLGDFRALEAIPFFVQNLDYQVPRSSLDFNPFRSYPCVSGLIAIGTPSYPEIRKRLERPIADHKLTLLAYIFRTIDGPEIGLARLEFFRREAENNTTVAGQQQRKNLDRLIDFFKTGKLIFQKMDVVP